MADTLNVVEAKKPVETTPTTVAPPAQPVTQINQAKPALPGLDELKKQYQSDPTGFTEKFKTYNPEQQKQVIDYIKQQKSQQTPTTVQKPAVQPVTQGNQKPLQTPQKGAEGQNVGGQQPATAGAQNPTVQSQTQGQTPATTAKPTTEQPKFKFGYGTTPEERDQRDMNMANSLLAKQGWKWDEKQVANSIQNEVAIQGATATPEDIQNTVNNIKSKYDTLQLGNQLSTTDANTLVNNLMNGSLTTAKLDALKLVDPGKFNAVMGLYAKQQKMATFGKELNGGKDTTVEDTTKQVESAQSEFYKTLQGLFKEQTTSIADQKKMLEDYNKEKNSPENQAMVDQINTITNDIKAKDQQIEDVRTELKKRYEGTGMTSGTLEALVADQTYQLTHERNSKALELQGLSASYQSKMQVLNDSYDTKVKTYALEQQATKNKMDMFQLSYGIFKDEQAQKNYTQTRQDQWDMLYANQDFQKQQATTAFDRQFGNIDSKDPAAQKVAVTKAVEQIMEQNKGRPFKRSEAEMVDDIMGLVKSGKTLGQALGENITGQLSQNPDYKTWIQSQYGGKQAEYMTVTQKDANGNETTYMVNKYKPSDFYQLGGGSSLNSDILKLPDGTTGGQCGSFVNKALGTPSLFGDSIEQKMTKKNSDVPEVGSAVIMNSSTFPKNGHVGIVQSVNDDGTITIKDSNWNGDEKVGTHKIKVDSSLIKGYYNPNLGDTTANTKDYPQYKAYFESGKLPVGMKDGTKAAESFKAKAQDGYLKLKTQEYKAKGFHITNPDVFINLDKKTVNDLNTSIDTVQQFNNSLDKLRGLVSTYGRETQSYMGVGKEMNQLVKDLQLKAKEIYNLGVLNGPDLSLMEQVIPNPTGPGLAGKEDLLKGLDNAKNIFNQNIMTKANNVGLGAKTTDSVNTGGATTGIDFIKNFWNSINTKSASNGGLDNAFNNLING